jgi:hypothetical protein
MIGHKTIEWFCSKKRTVFWVDGAGALLTGILLSQVLARFEALFGMPSAVLYPLAFVAGVFSFYSFLCYFFAVNNKINLLAIIMVANLVYVIISLWLVIVYSRQLRVAGLIYFISEAVVVLLVVTVEYKCFKRWRTENTRRIQ